MPLLNVANNNTPYHWNGLCRWHIRSENQIAAPPKTDWRIILRCYIGRMVQQPTLNAIGYLIQRIINVPPISFIWMTPVLSEYRPHVINHINITLIWFHCQLVQNEKKKKTKKWSESLNWDTADQSLHVIEKQTNQKKKIAYWERTSTKRNRIRIEFDQRSTIDCDRTKCYNESILFCLLHGAQMTAINVWLA